MSQDHPLASDVNASCRRCAAAKNLFASFPVAYATGYTRQPLRGFTKAASGPSTRYLVLEY